MSQCRKREVHPLFYLVYRKGYDYCLEEREVKRLKGTVPCAGDKVQFSYNDKFYKNGEIVMISADEEEVLKAMRRRLKGSKRRALSMSFDSSQPRKASLKMREKLSGNAANASGTLNCQKPLLEKVHLRTKKMKAKAEEALESEITNSPILLSSEEDSAVSGTEEGSSAEEMYADNAKQVKNDVARLQRLAASCSSSDEKNSAEEQQQVKGVLTEESQTARQATPAEKQVDGDNQGVTFEKGVEGDNQGVTSEKGVEIDKQDVTTEKQVEGDNQGVTSEKEVEIDKQDVTTEKGVEIDKQDVTTEKGVEVDEQDVTTEAVSFCSSGDGLSSRRKRRSHSRRDRKKKKERRRRSSSSSSSSSSTSSSSSDTDHVRRNKRCKAVKRNLEVFPGANYLWSEKDDGVVQVHDKYKVYIKQDLLETALAGAKSPMQFVRTLVDKVYTVEALEGSTACGFPPRGKGAKYLKKKKVLPRLHPDGRLAILARASQLEDERKSWRPRVGGNTINQAFTSRVGEF